MADPVRTSSAGGAEPRFVLGPLTLYADVARMAAWLETAAPGDEIVYATGPALGRDAPAGTLARSWSDEGEVVLFQRRPGQGKPLEYVARRRDPPVQPRTSRLFGNVRAGRARPPLAAPAAMAETIEGRVLALITRAADAGVICPSNREIAVALALNSRDAAQYAITKLARAGLIRVNTSSSFDGRQVTITATGATTAARARSHRLPHTAAREMGK